MSVAPYHAVFDLDGTLVDSVEVCTLIMNGMLVDRGSARRLTSQEARPHITFGGVNMVISLFGEECGDPDLEIAEFRTRYRDLPTPASSLYAGVREGLVELVDAGVTLSVCSNKPQNLCEKVLADLDLSDLFVAVAGSQPDMPLKPDAALFDKAIEGAKARRDFCCLVGDSEVDYELARRVGVPFVFVTYGYSAGAMESFPDAAYAHTFNAVPALVQRAKTAAFTVT